MAPSKLVKERNGYRFGRWTFHLIAIGIPIDTGFVLNCLFRWSWIDSAQAFFIFAAVTFVVIRFMYFSRLGRDVYLSLTSVPLFCPECGKNIPRLADWQCGYCDNENKDQLRFPVFRCCEFCKEPPRSLECWSCEKLVYFTEEHDGLNPARVLGKKPKVTVAKIALKPLEAPVRVPPLDPIEAKTKDHVLKKTDLLHEIEITQLQTQLEQVKASSPTKQQVSMREKLVKAYEEYETEVMGAKNMARDLRKNWDVIYRDDPEARREYEEVLKEFLASKGFGSE